MAVFVAFQQSNNYLCYGTTRGSGNCFVKRAFRIVIPHPLGPSATPSAALRASANSGQAFFCSGQALVRNPVPSISLDSRFSGNDKLLRL